MRERNALTSLFAPPCPQRNTPSEIPKPCGAGRNPPSGRGTKKPLVEAVCVLVRTGSPAAVPCALMHAEDGEGRKVGLALGSGAPSRLWLSILGTGVEVVQEAGREP